MQVYKSYALNKQAIAISKKDSTKTKMVEDGSYEMMKNKYQNDVVSQAVTGSNSLVRIVQRGNKLHRLSDPIYNVNYTPVNVLDYRAPLYVPVKHFAGMTIPTTYFNLLVIWFMTLLLVFSLNNDWLKKFFKLFQKKP